MKLIAVLNRLKENGVQTVGQFALYQDIHNIFNCKTLELGEHDNKKEISNICSGVYNVVTRYSSKFGWHFHILDVEDRDYILIHSGNDYEDTLGCVLVGKEFTDLNRDGHIDVTSSRSTLDKLLELTPNGFKLIINDLYLN